MPHVAPPAPSPQAAVLLSGQVEAYKAARRALLLAELADLDSPPRAEPETQSDTSGLVEAVAAMLAKITPATAAEVAADREDRRIRPRIMAAGFSPEHLPALSTFAPCPQQLSTLQDIRRLAVRGSGAIIVVVGPRGTGKTHLAAQIARDYAEQEVHAEDALADHARAATASASPRDYLAANAKPQSVSYALHYMTAARLFGRMKELFANVGTIHAESRQREMDMLIAADLVIVDELQEAADGNEKRLGLGKILTALCDGRYAARRPTILISNHYDPQQPRSISLITEFLGDSITSRANQYGAFLIANWQSFRG